MISPDGVESAVAQFAFSDNDQSLLLISRVSQIREQVEESFHEIGALLNHLAGVTTAFSLAFKQDACAGNELPERAAKWSERPKHEGARIEQDQTPCADNVEGPLDLSLDPRPLNEASGSKPVSSGEAVEDVNHMIANLMSTLQFGDIACQRLDNIGRSLMAVQDAELSFEERAAFMSMIADQICHTLTELISNCGTFAENIALTAGKVETVLRSANHQRLGLADGHRNRQERPLQQWSELSETTGTEQRSPPDKHAQTHDSVREMLANQTNRLKARMSTLSELLPRQSLFPSELEELVLALRAQIPRLREITEGADTTKTHFAHFERETRAPAEQSQSVETLSLLIFALYTMNTEREVHKRHFWVDIDSTDGGAIKPFATSEAAEGIDLGSVLF
jgi:hypothetical protein